MPVTRTCASSVPVTLVSAVVNPWTRPRSIGLLSMVRSIESAGRGSRRIRRRAAEHRDRHRPFDGHPLGRRSAAGGCRASAWDRRSTSVPPKLSYLNSRKAPSRTWNWPSTCGAPPLPATVPEASRRPVNCGGLSRSASTLARSTFFSVKLQRAARRAERPVRRHLLIAAHEPQILRPRRRRCRTESSASDPGASCQARPSRLQRQLLEVDFLMIGMKRSRPAGRERTRRLLRGGVELQLLVLIGRLRRELVDVLPADRHERRLRVGRDR